MDSTDSAGRRGIIGNNDNSDNAVPVITIYPNPATNEVNIATSKANWANGTIINVYNLIGKRVYQAIPDNTSNSLVINTTSWINGIYLFSVQEKGKTETFKVVIEK